MVQGSVVDDWTPSVRVGRFQGFWTCSIVKNMSGNWRRRNCPKKITQLLLIEGQPALDNKPSSKNLQYFGCNQEKKRLEEGNHGNGETGVSQERSVTPRNYFKKIKK